VSLVEPRFVSLVEPRLVSAGGVSKKFKSQCHSELDSESMHHIWRRCWNWLQATAFSM